MEVQKEEKEKGKGSVTERRREEEESECESSEVEELRENGYHEILETRKEEGIECSSAGLWRNQFIGEFNNFLFCVLLGDVQPEYFLRVVSSM